MNTESTVFEDRNNEEILGSKLDSHRINVTLADFFEISDKAQEGGMGDVYFCRDKRDNRFYVLKKAKKTEYEDIFEKEAELVLKLEKNPYVVYTKTIISDNTSYYIVMNYIGKQPYNLDEKVEGETLTKVMNKTNIEPKQAVIWAIQFCKGMTFLNKSGIEAHKDIKPDNILIDPNNIIKITDFGLASIDKKGGTPGYMPPEYKKQNLTIQSDIFSFGLVLYQMFNNGKLLSSQTVFNKDTNESEFVYESNWTSNHCQEVIKKCLQKEPSKRYKNFEELERELTQYLHDKWPEYTLPELKAEPMTAEDCFLKGLGYYVLSNGICTSNRLNIIAWFDQAIKLNPRCSKAYYFKYLALSSVQFYASHPIAEYICNHNKGEMREIVLTMKQARILSPIYANLIGLEEMKRSYEYSPHGYENIQYKIANKCFLEVINKDPNNPVGYNNIACSSLYLGVDITIILNYLNKAIALDPKYAVAYYNRAKINEKNNPKQALEDYNKAIQLNMCEYELNPDLIISDNFINGKLNFLLREGKFKNIKNMYNVFLKQFKLNPIIKQKIVLLIKLLSLREQIKSYHKEDKKLIGLYKKYFDYVSKYRRNKIKLQNIIADNKYNTKQKNIQNYLLNSRPISEHRFYNREWFYHSACLLKRNASSYNEWGCLDFEKALKERDTDNLYTALKYFNKALKIDPKYVNAYYNRGDTYFYLRKYEKALSDYNKAIELSPNDMNFIGARMEKNIANEEKVCLLVRSRQGKYVQVLGDYIEPRKQDMIIIGNELFPVTQDSFLIKEDDNKVHLFSGKIYNDINNPIKAIKEFQKIDKKDHEQDLVYFHMGNSYYLLGKYKRAISCYEKSIYYLESFSKECQSDSTEIIKERFCYIETVYNMYQCYKQLGDTDRAQEYYQNFRSNNNKYYFIKNNAIMLENELGENKDLEYHNALWKRGMIKYAMKDYEGAIKDYLQATDNVILKISTHIPRNWVKEFGYARLFQEGKNKINNFNLKEDIKFKIFIDIGDAYYQLGKYKEAFKYYKQVIKNHKFIHFFYTDTLFKLGKYKEAIVGYLNYIKDITTPIYADREDYYEIIYRCDSPKEKERLKQIYKNLVVCYNAIGKSQKAEEYKNFKMPQKRELKGRVRTVRKRPIFTLREGDLFI